MFLGLKFSIIKQNCYVTVKDIPTKALVLRIANACYPAVEKKIVYISKIKMKTNYMIEKVVEHDITVSYTGT